ncbi:murein biosynthesis integral membrane protein MurJ [Alloscardovia venturai]|uniref:Murein biosynthesis integral membrane protein MurJ n=1 Tax=Alloscardovia venturai TaxID=1769421 RepID=A0ABW2Y3B5_9BIFI
MSSVSHNSVIMASGTLASRLTGMIRTILLAAAVGTTGIAANAYQTGSSVPQIIYTLISGGIFNAILVPQIVRTLKSENSKKNLDKLVTLSMAILFGVTIIIMAGTHIITSIFLSSSWTPAQHALADAFTLWCTPQIFFYGIYTVLGQILAAKNRFAMYAWSSVAANVVSCAGFIIFIAMFGNASHKPLDFWTTDKIALTAGAWTLGVAVQALLLFIPLIQSGYIFSFSWGFRGIGLRSMGNVAVWTIGITILSQITMIITSRIASGAPLAGGDPYGIAGNGSYQNAMTIYILPYSLFAVSLTTATFPQISTFVAERRIRDAADTLESSLRSNSLIMFFFTAVMIAIPLQLSAVFLPSVSGTELGLIAPIMMALTFSLPASSAMLLAQRAFYAFEDGKSPFIIACIQSGILIIIQLFTALAINPHHQAMWLGIAVSVSYYLAMPAVLIMTYRLFRGNLRIGKLAVSHIKILIASVCTALVACVVQFGLSTLFHFSPQSAHGKAAWFVALLICDVTTLISGAVYAGVLIGLREKAFITLILSLLRRISPNITFTHRGGKHSVQPPFTLE